MISLRTVGLVFGLLCAIPSAIVARPAMIILLRHAEKPPERYAIHLSERGRERAQALAYFLGTNQVFVTNGLPVALFAPQFTPRGHGRRPYETLEPLAERLKLRVQTPFGAADYGALAELVLKDPTLDDKTVVICGIHDYLADLARKLGVKPTPKAWSKDSYDRVWLITYRKHRAILDSIPQNLLPGDSLND